MDEANSKAVLTFDGDHRSALAETMELPGGSPDCAADRKNISVWLKIGHAAHDNALKKPYTKIV